MRALLALANSGGADYYRVREPARAVQESALDVDVLLRPGIATTMKPTPGGEELQVVDVDVEGADVVVLQLPKTKEMLAILRMLQARGVAVVVELDDSMSAVAYGHAAYTAIIRGGMGQWARQCALEADLVTVSTPALLQEYAPHGRGVVVPNAIPRRLAELPPAYERNPEVVTIGWSGNVLGHPYDLQEMGSGLQQALDRTRGRSRFTVLGQKWDARERLLLSEEPTEVPWKREVDDYVVALGELFDVGIAPLRLDRFNQAKSWLKPLEYSARGVFCVRARTEEYERLGLGLPARSAKDWSKWLITGIEDADRRRELAADARERVLAGHLTEHTAERWVSAWQRARENRRLAMRQSA